MRLSVAPTMKSVDELTVVVDVDQVFALTGWTIARLRGAIDRGEFPRPFARHPRRWHRADLVRWTTGETQVRPGLRRAR